MDSILTSIKKFLGLEAEYVYFDEDIIIHINSALYRLNTLGIGPHEGFVVTDKTQAWSDFLSARKDLELVKTYVYLKVRLVFDPPQTSFLLEAINKQISELEWLLNE